MPGTLHAVGLSQPARSCLLLIKEAKLNVPLENVDLMSGAHKKEPFLSINPAGQVPAYVDGDFKLAEGGAILQYLAESNNLTQWYPTDPHAKAKVNQWLHWNHTNTRKSTKFLLSPALFGRGEVDTTEYCASLVVLDGVLAKSKFVASTEHPTIADLFILPELDQVGPDFFEGLFDYSPYPNVERYMADLKAALPLSYAQNVADAVAIKNMFQAAGAAKAAAEEKK